jgi:hypothetical protein
MSAPPIHARTDGGSCFSGILHPRKLVHNSSSGEAPEILGIHRCSREE